MINIFIQDIEEVSEQKYKDFFRFLPKHMQEEVSRYKVKKDRKRTLVGKMLLSTYLIEYTNFNLNHIEITKYNKPYIPNSDINFNISHSGKYVVIVFTFSNIVGIDIEEIRSNIDIHTMKEVLLNFEYKNIQNSKHPYKDFCTLWVQKEALLKAKGKGFLNNIKEIKIKKDKIFFKNEEYNIYLTSFDNYILALVYQYSDQIQIIRKDL